MKIIALGNNKGFTLIEALVCLFVISIGLLGITRMQITSINGNTVAINNMNAVLESNSLIEQMLSMNYTSAELAATPDGQDDIEVPLPKTNNKFTTNYTVTRIGVGETNQSVKQVTLRTTWNDGKGNTKNFSTAFFMVPQSIKEN